MYLYIKVTTDYQTLEYIYGGVCVLTWTNLTADLCLMENIYSFLCQHPSQMLYHVSHHKQTVFLTGQFLQQILTDSATVLLIGLFQFLQYLMNKNDRHWEIYKLINCISSSKIGLEI